MKFLIKSLLISEYQFYQNCSILYDSVLKLDYVMVRPRWDASSLPANTQVKDSVVTSMADT
jgi:hypothetical protein